MCLLQFYNYLKTSELCQWLCSSRCLRSVFVTDTLTSVNYNRNHMLQDILYTEYYLQ